jgi:hypothetical protein
VRTDTVAYSSPGLGARAPEWGGTILGDKA